MADRLLTDTELRAAAASRPGYATHPQYRPQAERLGRLPSVARVRPAVPAPAPAPVQLDGRQPVAAEPDEITVAQLAALPVGRVFDFAPRLLPGRPWWRRRWTWAVMSAAGGVSWGYAWTYRGARWRTARAVRWVR